MPVGTIRLGNIEVSRLIIGGNSFSGVSHKNRETDLAMKRFFTVERIKQTLRSADDLGITAFVGRAARHLRPGDGVCIGVYQEHKPGMLAEDVRLFEEYS
jgi:hypothetical protein